MFGANDGADDDARAERPRKGGSRTGPEQPKLRCGCETRSSSGLESESLPESLANALESEAGSNTHQEIGGLVGKLR